MNPTSSYRHLRGLRLLAPVFCSLAVLSSQLQAAPTIQLNGDDARDGMADSGRVGYVGGNTRIGVSIDRDLQGQIDIDQVLMESESSVTSVEGWFGYKLKDDVGQGTGIDSGGAKLNHQWVNGAADTVHKVFGAYDQNVDDIGKATVGYGQETEDLFWSVQASKGIGDGVKNGSITTRPYDYGVGAEVGTFLEGSLMRLRGGLDYEFGTQHADNEDMPGRATVSAGVEKFFHDSPHSISLDVSGNKIAGGNDLDSSDYNARLGYNYEFGGNGTYRSAESRRRVRVEVPGTAARPGRPARPAQPARAGRPGQRAIAAIPAIPAIRAQPGRPAIPAKYKRQMVKTPTTQFVKTTMKLENETFFKLNSANLTQSARQNLDKIISQVRSNGYTGAIRITGNTCGLGNAVYDQQLSERRANAVRNYLVSKGINPQHLIARGLGKGSPKYDRNDHDFRNRRVDIEYVTERTIKKQGFKTEYRNVLIQAGLPAVPAHPGRPGRPGRAGRAAIPAVPARAAIPAMAAIPGTPGTPSRFIWKTEVVKGAPLWIKRALRNNIRHNKSIGFYTTSTGPKASDDSFTITDRGSMTMDVTANDGDANTTTLVRVTQPENGTVTIVGGNVQFVPNPGFSGDDSFTYTIVDENGEETTARVNVNVPAPIVTNSAPVAVADSGSTNEGQSVVIPVLTNDTDPDGDTLTIQSVTQPQGGTAVITADGIQYTPNPGFTGQDMFSYVIVDSEGNQSTATVTINVNNVNSAPVAQDDNNTTPENTPVTINVLGNDSDPDGDSLTITGTGTPANGTVAIVNGQLEYTPNAGFSGNDMFTYTISDGNGNTRTANVTITVTSSNVAPIATDDVRNTPEDTAITISVMNNDSDPDGDSISITNMTNPSNGTITLVGTDIVYTPNSGFTGIDTFTYSVSDGNGGTTTATVTVTVDDANSAPIATDDTRTTQEDTPVTISVLNNDSDPDGDNISISSTTNPANGTIAISGTDIVYTPGNGFSGQDTFTYTITDGNGNTQTANVIVMVTDVNAAPNVVDDTRTTSENLPVTIPVLGNDSDPDGDTLTISSTTNPANGAVTVVGNDIVYVPNNGFSGNDMFTYTVSDGNGNTQTATVSVMVTDTNMAPDAVDDSSNTTPENTPVTVSVLSNDSDPDGDALTITGTTPPANGTISVSGGNIVYTPNPGYTGTDSYTYTVSDGNGNTDTATVTITVTDVNDPPTPASDTGSTPENTPVTINVLANDTDPDGDTLTLVSTTTPANGTAVIQNGQIVYTPTSGFTGTDTFSYTVTDGQGNNQTSVVTVNVTDVNYPPIAADDNDSTPMNMPVTLSVLGNDGDIDGDTITIINPGSPANGSVTVSGSNIIYTPANGFVGTDSFVYTISDGNGNTDTATATVVVTSVNQAPVTMGDSDSTPQDTPVTINVLGNDSDPESDPLTISTTSNPANGSVTVSGGNITYTPASGFTGADSFTYTVNDGNGNTSTATVNVTVTPPANPDPIAVDDNASTPFDTPVTINVAANDSDPDGGSTCVSNIASQPANGTVSISASGTDIVYTPTPGFTGTDSFVYVACDGEGGSDTATVTVTVGAPANQAPSAVNDSDNTAQDTPVTISVLGNDTDPESDTLNISNVGSPSNGTAVISGSNIVYTPANGYTGTDSFTYTITDGNGNTSTATVTVGVSAAANPPPVAVDDNGFTHMDTPVTIPVAGNDTDPDGGSTCVSSIIMPPASGSVAIATSGTDIIYTPNPGFTGNDSFVYEACDGEGGNDTATVSVYVKAPKTTSPRAAASNNAPWIGAVPTQSAYAGSPVTLDIRSYISDLDGDSVYIAIADALSGSVRFSGTVLEYTGSQAGNDTVYITVSDGKGGFADSTVRINVR